MKSKLKLFAILTTLVGSAAGATTLSVKMQANCRYPDGRYQASAGQSSIIITPANEDAANELNQLATLAAQTKHTVAFTIEGAVTSDEVNPGPRGDPTTQRVIEILVNLIKTPSAPAGLEGCNPAVCGDQGGMGPQPRPRPRPRPGARPRTQF